MNNFTGGYNNDAQRQRFATQQVCSPQEESSQQEKGGRLLAGPLRGTSRQLIGTALGIVAGIAVLVLLSVLR